MSSSRAVFDSGIEHEPSVHPEGDEPDGEQGWAPRGQSPEQASETRRRLRRRLLISGTADWVVRLGGISILLSISAIFVVILLEALPLFLPPSVESAVTLNAASPITRAGTSRAFVDANAGWIGALWPNGALESHRVDTVGGGTEASDSGAPAAVPHALPAHDALGMLCANLECSELFSIWGSGEVVALRLQLPTTHERLSSAAKPSVVVEEAFSFSGDPSTSPTLNRPIAAIKAPQRTIVAASRDQGLALHAVVEKKALGGGGAKQQLSVDLPLAAKASALTFDPSGKLLFVALASGDLRIFDLKNISAPKELGATALGREVTAMQLLIGGQTLVVGDSKGGVSSWMFVGGAPTGGGKLTLIHEYQSHPAAVEFISVSPRNRGFVTADQSGVVKYHYSTEGATQLSFDAIDGVEKLAAVSLAPTGDAIATVDARGVMRWWPVHNPHPEASVGSLFGKVWYEGYAGPEYVWQSSGGSDESEPKFSLVPLIFGTLKGTFYSLLFAVPLAILGALYTAEFMGARLRGLVKPVVELMAALPSVVIGFIAGLWLAPAVEPHLGGVLLAPFVLPIVVLIGVTLWQRSSKNFRAYWSNGRELALLLPLVAFGFWLSFAFGGQVESQLLGQNTQGWFSSAFGIAYDQRNSLVVGLAMGFAVIPLIFTISEDALSSVPQHLRAASLAVGANRWQTALRVILPAASPGIFSAVMLGFGRAVGETMIVLMATGNTPIMDPSAFSGFRALSANIAVELPEAAQGGTLFRILFFAALLLFVFAFFVNSMSELIRVQLRKRYGSL